MTSETEYNAKLDRFDYDTAHMTTTSQAFCYFATLGCIDLNALDDAFKKLGIEDYGYSMIQASKDAKASVEFVFTFSNPRKAHEFINYPAQKALDKTVKGILEDKMPEIEGKLNELAGSVGHKIVPK